MIAFAFLNLFLSMGWLQIDGAHDVPQIYNPQTGVTLNVGAPPQLHQGPPAPLAPRPVAHQ